VLDRPHFDERSQTMTIVPRRCLVHNPYPQ
jgi:hypothetical protein